jgi:hypothetical protein
MNTTIKFTLLSFLFLFSTCGDESREPGEEPTPEQAEQIAEFREQFDSLNQAVLTRIQQLEDSMQNLAAEEREAIEREITYLREVHEEISTRKDNLKVEHRDNWHFFRQEMEQSLVEIESRLNRTQER